MSGGETEKGSGDLGVETEKRGPPSESEEVFYELGQEEGEGEEEGVKVRGEKESKGEVVLEKAGKADA